MHLLEQGEAPWTRDDVTAVAAALGMDTEVLVRHSMQTSSRTEPDRRKEFVRWACGRSTTRGGAWWTKLTEPADSVRTDDVECALVH